MPSENLNLSVTVPAYSEAAGLSVSWADGYRLRVRVSGDPDRGYEVVIEGNAAGFDSLARHALALAQSGVPSGFHFHLEDSSGLDPPSAALVLDREDDPGAWE